MHGTRKFVIRDDATRARAMAYVGELPISDRPLEVVVRQHRSSRTLDQNDLLQDLCHDLAAQVDWYGIKLTNDDWRHIFTATVRGQRSVPNLDGTGFVVLGASSKQLTVGEASQVIDMILAFGRDNGVRFQQEAA